MMLHLLISVVAAIAAEGNIIAYCDTPSMVTDQSSPLTYALYLLTKHELTRHDTHGLPQRAGWRD